MRMLDSAAALHGVESAYRLAGMAVAGIRLGKICPAYAQFA